MANFFFFFKSKLVVLETSREAVSQREMLPGKGAPDLRTVAANVISCFEHVFLRESDN